MKRITIVRALAALAVVPALALVTSTSKRTVRAVYAGAGCGDATLNGNYAVIQPAGFTANGKSTTGGEVPWQFVGVTNFDGHGGITASYTAVVNGVIYPNQTGSGTYTVNSVGPNSECTGSLIFTSGNGGAGYMANIAVVGGGAEVFGISTNPGGTATFDAKKQ